MFGGSASTGFSGRQCGVWLAGTGYAFSAFAAHAMWSATIVWMKK